MTRSPSRSLAAVLASLTLMLGAVSLGACSDDTKDKASDTAESAKEDAKDAKDDADKKASEMKDDADKKAGDLKEDAENGVGAVAARAGAEALRASLKGNNTANEKGVRSMAAIEQAAKDLPGDLTLEGLEDSDGDGLDDDGKVQINSGDSSACLSLPETGEDTKVESGAC